MSTDGRRSSAARPARDVKAAIVASAIQEFARRGYRRTTIAAIARDVGLTDAGVLYHFPTKAALFTAVVGYYTELQRDRFAAMIEPGGLQAFVNLRAWGDVMEERPDLVGLQVVLSTEAVTGSDELHRYFVQRYADLRMIIGGLLEGAKRDGDIDPSVDSELEATSLITFLDGIRLQWLYDPDHVSISRSLKTYIDRAVEGMRAGGHP
jgi:AcrR family transcriptional regulator